MQRGDVAVVTGVSCGGIGLETAKALYKAGCVVVLACRNEGRARAAMKEIEASTPSADCGDLEFMPLNLASLRSVEHFAKQLQVRHPRVKALVNNAGLNTIGDHSARTDDGLPLAFGVNFVGHFHLTNHLLPCLKAAEPSRIVNVSSQMHRSAVVAEMPHAGTEASPSGYSNSKLAMVWHAHELTRRMQSEGTDVKAFAVSPGAVRTQIWRTLPWYLKPIFKLISYIFMLSPAQGASTSIRAVMDPALKGGEYLSPYRFAAKYPKPFDYLSFFGGPRVIPSSPASYDPPAEARLFTDTQQVIDAALAHHSTRS